MTIKITKQMIKNSGTISVNNIVDHSHDVIQFRTDPIAVLEHMTGYDKGSRSGRDYTSIFTDPEDWSSEYNHQLEQIEAKHINEQDLAQAQRTREHWEDVLVIKRLRGEQLTDWERDLSDFLAQTAQNQCYVKYLKQFCKLGVFYTEYCDVIKLLNHYPTPKKTPARQFLDNLYQHNELKYIQDIPENAGYLRNRLRFFFEDAQGELYVWCPERSDYAKPMLEMLWQGYQPCEYRLSRSHIYDKPINKIYDLKPIKQ